jgi:hypothetical protein
MAVDVEVTTDVETDGTVARTAGEAVDVEVTTDVETDGTVARTAGEAFGFTASQTVPSLSTSSFLFARYTEALTFGFEICFFAFVELTATP